MSQIYQLRDWPHFSWDRNKLAESLAAVRHRQGRFLGRLESISSTLQMEATISILKLDIVKSGEMEGELINPGLLQASLSRRLGKEGIDPSSGHRPAEGLVDVALDTTLRFEHLLTVDRLFGWHAALYPKGHGGIHRIAVGVWRDQEYPSAPDASLLPDEMFGFLQWFNTEHGLDPVIKAAIAHIWFVLLRPFNIGNGRIALAITDLQLSRADDINGQRFYSFSAQIRKERNNYQEVLQKAQEGSMDVTTWIGWFLRCLDHAITAAEELLASLFRKATFWEQYAALTFNDRQKKVLITLLERPHGKVSSSEWATLTQSSADSAIRDINDLVKKGVLLKELAGGRSTHYTLKEG